jgi:hypothetical protein
MAEKRCKGCLGCTPADEDADAPVPTAKSGVEMASADKAPPAAQL